MIEAAPRLKRGLYVSFQYMGQDAAVLLVGIVGEVLSQLLTADQLDRWGWRLVFGIGFMIVPFGLMLAGAGLLEKVQRRPLITRDQVRRTLEDKAFDIGEAREALGGWTPRPFEEAMALKVAGNA
jgi:MFS family permease